MAKYLKICEDCKNKCKQKAGVGIRIISCAMFELKESPLVNTRLVAESSGASLCPNNKVDNARD